MCYIKVWRVVYGGWWLYVYVFAEGSGVCQKISESEENVTPRPFFLGLFIGQELGFKVTYLGSQPYTCRGWIPYTCPGVSMGIIFWNVPVFVSIAQQLTVVCCLYHLECQSVTCAVGVSLVLYRLRVRGRSSSIRVRDPARAVYLGRIGGCLVWLATTRGRSLRAGSGFSEFKLYPIT